MAAVHRLHDDPRLPPAVAPFFTHEYITYHAVMASGWIEGCEQVEPEPEPDGGTWPVGPDHVNRFFEPLLDTRGTPSTAAIDGDAFDCEAKYVAWPDAPRDAPPVDPWKVLVLYAAEPDTRLDCDIELHWSQAITQGSHGLRHMQFRIAGMPFGRLVGTFEHHAGAARRTFAAGHAYWGWRYLSRAVHYLEDIGHPLHVKIMPARLLPSLLRDRRRALVRLTIAHNGHEVFTQQRFRDGAAAFGEAIAGGVARATETRVASFQKEVRRFKARSARRASRLFLAMDGGFGNDLADVYQGMDHDPQVDASKRTLHVEALARDAIFKDPGNPVLGTLEELTVEMLDDVGFMTGLLLDRVRAGPRTSWL